MKIPGLLVTALACCLPLEAMAGAILDLNTPVGVNQAMRKIQCSTIDQKPVYFWWQGKVFSRRMGEADKHLFNVEGMNVRQCASIDGGKRGKSYRLVSREILLYTDKNSGQPLQKWQNPWTDETVDVLHVMNDPVNQPVRFPFDNNGEPNPSTAAFPGTVMQDQWALSLDFPLFYHNALGGGYQQQIGGVYHATEMFNFSGDLENLIDSERDSAKAHVSWVRISQWLPFMMMSGREGMIYIHGSGFKVAGYDDMGEVIKTFIAQHAPEYRNPPPVDDTRSNQTSWSTYKDEVPGAMFKRQGH